MSKDRATMTLEAELKELEAANEAANSWGAAVGARHERIKEIKSQLARQTERKAVTVTVEGENPQDVAYWAMLLREHVVSLGETAPRSHPSSFVIQPRKQ